VRVGMPNKLGQFWLVPRAANEPVDNAKRLSVPPACERGDHRAGVNSLAACQLREALAVLNVDRQGVKIDTVDRGADAALPNDRSAKTRSRRGALVSFDGA
jgi:hypothetical protein